MNSGYKLGQELAHHEYLRKQLAERFPDANEETLLDTLEGMTDLNDMLAELIRSSLDDKALVAALKQRVIDMKLRCARFETRAQKKRDLVWSMMEHTGIKKIAAPDLTVNLRAGKASVVVTDERKIPKNFWRPQAPTLNHPALYKALMAGKTVLGTMLNNPSPTLSVRTK